MATDPHAYIETTVYDLLNGGTGSDPMAQLEGFRFGRPIVSFGDVPSALYSQLDELDALDAAAPYAPKTRADVDDLRYLWRKLGFAKEAGEGSRQAALTWNDDASTVSDSDLEAMREVLEHHYEARL